MNSIQRAIFSCICLFVAGCATDSSQHFIAGKNEPFTHTKTYDNGTVVTGTLLNGQWQGPGKAVVSDGTIVTGNLLNDKWEGPAEITDPKGTKCNGDFVNGQRNGLWKCYSKLNDLTTYTLYTAGKILKSFSDLEQLWATGNYEEAYRVRGKKSLLGINLKKSEKTSDIIADVIQIHSPAFMSGFQAGDVFVSFDGESVLNIESLIRRIVETPFGMTVNVDVMRDGRKISLSVVPATIPRNFIGKDGRPVMSSADRLWEHYLKLDSAEGFSKYLETINDPTYKPVASLRLQAALDREKKLLQSAIDSRDTTRLADYLERYPASPLRRDAIAGVNEVLRNSKQKAPAYLGFVGRCQSCAELLPSEFRILDIGPAGMTVADLLRLSEQGINADVIAAKIEGSAAEYKDFTFKEIAFLNMLNVPSNVVSAMIRSTHANAGKKLQEQNRKLQEENLQLKQIAAEKEAAKQKSAASNAATSDECLQLELALAACDQGSGLLKTGCKIIARSTFKCNAR